MTAAQKLDANERRDQQFITAEWRCLVCGLPLTDGVPQLAHRIINSKRNAATIKPEALHSPLNTIPVCSLACNHKVILHGPAAVELLARIERVLAGEETVDYWDEYAKIREEFSHQPGGAV